MEGVLKMDWDCWLGTIILWPLDWAPNGWALCNGQELQITQNQALYSLLGTRFGGNGTTTFKLPDLRGSVPLGMGQAPTGTTYQVGQTGGVANTTLSVANLPSHTHSATFTPGGMTCAANGNFTIPATTTLANVAIPDSASYLAKPNKVGTTQVSTYNNDTAVIKDIQLPGGTVNVSGTVSGTGTVAVGATGSGAVVNNMQPYIVLNYIIATTGLYPSRP